MVSKLKYGNTNTFFVRGERGYLLVDTDYAGTLPAFYGAIKKYNIKERLNFIIGTDAFKKIESWYHSDELKNLVHFIVFPRIGDDIESIKSEFKQKGWDFEILECDFFNVSSTQIRKNVSSNQIDKKVKDYINGHDLYRNWAVQNLVKE